MYVSSTLWSVEGGSAIITRLAQENTCEHSLLSRLAYLCGFVCGLWLSDRYMIDIVGKREREKEQVRKGERMRIKETLGERMREN